MSHEKDIHHGKAVVPYAPWAASPTLNWPDSVNLSEGWVLPGGHRTQDYMVALSVAKGMAEVIG